MIGFLWRLIVGRFSRCEHQWETKENLGVWSEDGDYKHPIYIDKHLCCTKCGTWKRVRL
jgi:hypothetical protein